MATDPPSLAAELAAGQFSVLGNDLVVSGNTVHDLAAAFGTPLFVYDADLMRRTYRDLANAVSGFADIYYSIKANPNPAVARVFVEAGAGVEVASHGEYLLARHAGAAPGRIIFAGPGKTAAELDAVARDGIGEIHLETHEEISRLEAIGAKHGRRIPVSMRLNPVMAAQGGAMRMGGKPAPFGFDEETLDAVIDDVRGRPHLDLHGIHVFTGTQILDAAVLTAQWTHAIDIARRTARRLGQPLRTIDLGGGLGIPYFTGDKPLDLDAVAATARTLSKKLQADPLLRKARVILEPGRYLAGPAGLYVVRVTAAKTSRGERFVITDGGMHHHLAASGNLGQVLKRDYPIVAPARMAEQVSATCAVVGPLCTPLDTLARKVLLPDLKDGDLIAVLQSGAYALSASPTGFLSHPTPAEILIDGGLPALVRPHGSAEASLAVFG